MIPKIGLCVIVEGDSKLDGLKQLYASVKDYIHATYITTNGGDTNESTLRVEEWCESEGINYSYLKWSDDFSAQRNFNFSQVDEDVQYILWADSDDVIVGAKYIPHIATLMHKKEYDSMFFPYWYGCKFKDNILKPENLLDVELTQMRERLLKVGSIVWKARIHETPIQVNGQNHKYSKVTYSEKPKPEEGKYPVAWLHLGADRSMSKEQSDKKMARNRRILELQLADERKESTADPRTLLYLMKIYVESTDEKLLKECIAMGEEYMEKSGWDAERAICAALMAKCMGNLGNDKGAAEFLHKAIAEYPHDPLLYLHLARTYFNLENYRAMKHWMRIGISMDIDEAQNNINNLLELKILSAELMLKFHLHADKNPEKAWEAARMLNAANPTETNQKNEDYLYDLKELNLASRNIDKYLEYLDSIGDTDKIVKTIENMPNEMQKLPFASNLYNKYVEPKVWASNEICYYANFGQNHFERWSPKNMEKGIGGSETAVIELSKKWVEMGYKVTVYGDPGLDEGIYDGVEYLPWYKFNHKDKFNIFIQWRSSHLAGKVSAKKFYVDLHDVFYEYDHIKRLDGIDKIFVKSKYHRSLAPKIPDDKFIILSNGI